MCRATGNPGEAARSSAAAGAYTPRMVTYPVCELTVIEDICKIDLRIQEARENVRERYYLNMQILVKSEVCFFFYVLDSKNKIMLFFFIFKI